MRFALFNRTDIGMRVKETDFHMLKQQTMHKPPQTLAMQAILPQQIYCDPAVEGLRLYSPVSEKKNDDDCRSTEFILNEIKMII